MTMLRSTVVGVYGVSGSGKSWALAQIGRKHPEWLCVEGSELIQNVMNDCDNNATFEIMNESEKKRIRNLAVKKLAQCAGITIVAGHCSFPTTFHSTDNSRPTFVDVFTEGDAETYDAILYLNTDAEKVNEQRNLDHSTSKRQRPAHTLETISHWIQHEKDFLSNECKSHGISFAVLDNDDDICDYISKHIVAPLIPAVKLQSEEALHAAVASLPRADLFLLVDGDRTLCPKDTGKLFFDRINDRERDGVNDVSAANVDHLKTIFKRYPMYTFQAFLEVALLYGNILTDADYKNVSREIGQNHVDIYKPFLAFLSSLPSNVHPILVTSGNREIWHAALAKTALRGSDDIPGQHAMSLIAGNNNQLHPYIVDDNAKQIIVGELREKCAGCRIISFGDSVIDVPMLVASDRAYVVVDDRHNRSMRGFLQDARNDRGKLYQISFAATTSTTMTSSRGATRNHAESSSTFLLPYYHEGIKVGSLTALMEELRSGSIHKVVHFMEGFHSARLLATKSRCADVCGPSLQSVHAEIGIFLADKLMDEFPHHLVNEKLDFPHVQGGTFQGCTTETIHHTAIVPLMRGGEPMSRGVHSRFPSARVVHWNDNFPPAEQDFLEVSNVIICDSVINSGHSVRRVLEHLQGQQRATVAQEGSTSGVGGMRPSALRPSSSHPLRLYVLTAVMHKNAAETLAQEYDTVRFLALRVSSNQYTGSGGTDTGNRLFGSF